MKKSTKILIVSMLTLTLSAGLMGCGEKDTPNESEAAVSSAEENTALNENSAAKADDVSVKFDDDVSDDSPGDNATVYEALKSVLENSDATGYTVCKINGSENYYLVLLYGSSKADCCYEFYCIGEDDIKNIGALEGGDTVAYISGETNRLGIYQTDSGNFSYGNVKYIDNSISVDWIANGTVENEKDYPEVPGEEVIFTPPDNYDLIVNFDNHLSSSISEEYIEVDE